MSFACPRAFGRHNHIERVNKMMLNLPILDHLSGSKNILIAGAGGGFDGFAGLPLYFTLREHGKKVHLANYSFTDLGLAGEVSDIEILQKDVAIGVSGPVRFPLPYFPEGYLAQWFAEEQGETVTVWMFGSTGVFPLKQAYAKLVEHLGIDALILIDGGVDSLMRGDESNPGSIIQDAISLAAVKSLELPVENCTCLGFGTEVEEGLSHHLALENMAGLAKENAFWGSCSLTKQMEAFRLYEAAARYVWEQPSHDKSHISTRIIPAVQGEFGNYHMYDDDKRTVVYISLFMGVYWFFDMEAVIRRNLLIDALQSSYTTHEARLIYRQMRQVFKIRSDKKILY